MVTAKHVVVSRAAILAATATLEARRTRNIPPAGYGVIRMIDRRLSYLHDRLAAQPDADYIAIDPLGN